MAIILGTKPVQDLTENANIAIGITLPIQRGATGYFNQSFNTIDAVKSNIKNLLQTKLGERVMQPNFGTRLWNILFQNQNNSDPIESQIEDAIENAISFWLPFVVIQEININKNLPTNSNENTFSVELLFRIQGLQDLETVTFNITE